jgi:hypothetical protein
VGWFSDKKFEMAYKLAVYMEANRALQKGLWRQARKIDRLRALLEYHGINPNNQPRRKRYSNAKQDQETSPNHGSCGSQSEVCQEDGHTNGSGEGVQSGGQGLEALKGTTASSPIVPGVIYIGTWVDD